MEAIEPDELTNIMTFIHNGKEELARSGKPIFYVNTKYSVITGQITDINFLNDKLIKHFSTKFHPATKHTRLYDIVMEWLIE